MIRDIAATAAIQGAYLMLQVASYAMVGAMALFERCAGPVDPE